MTTDADRAIELLRRLYFMCREDGDFSNGVTYQGIDEGSARADRFLIDVDIFLSDHPEEVPA